MKFYIGQCAKCGSELTEESLKKNRCVSCGTPIVLSDRERYEKTVRLYGDLKEFFVRRRYADAQKIYNSADFHKLFEKDELFSFYGLFLNHAAAPADADKARSFVNYLKQNTDGRLNKEERSEIESVLTVFESKNKDIVLSIAGFLLGGRIPSKIEKGDPYLLYCIANAGQLSTASLSALVKSEVLSAVNKTEIIRQAGKACQESPEKSYVKGFLYLCKQALSSKNLGGESKKEVAAILDALCGGMDSQKLKNKAARLIRRGGLRREGAEGGGSVVLEQARKKSLRVAAIVTACVMTALLAGILMYGSRPVGIEATPDNKTAYIYEDSLSLRYKVKRVFSWMESGTIQSDKLKTESYDPGMIGEQEITVSYKGMTASLLITVSPKTLAAPAVSVDNGVLALSGGASAGYTVTLGDMSTTASMGFDIKSWAAAQSLSPGAHTLRICAKGDGVRLIDSPDTEVTIYKLSAPFITQSGDQISYTVETGVSRCTVAKGGVLLCELSGAPYTLNPGDFAADENTLVAQAFGGGWYLDSDPAEIVVKKAAAPSFSAEDVADDAIQNAEGLECWYRPAGGSGYLRRDALISDLNLLPAEAGLYEVVLRRPLCGNELGSDFSAPVTFTRIAPPIFEVDRNFKSVYVPTIYDPSLEVSIVFYYKRYGDRSFTKSDKPLQDLLDSCEEGKGYYIQAVARSTNRLVLASALGDYEAPDAGYLQTGKYIFQWRYAIFSESESVMVVLNNVQYPLAIVKVTDAYGNYYRASTSNNTFSEVRIYTVESNFMFFIGDGKNS